VRKEKNPSSQTREKRNDTRKDSLKAERKVEASKKSLKKKTQKKRAKPAVGGQNVVETQGHLKRKSKEKDRADCRKKIKKPRPQEKVQTEAVLRDNQKRGKKKNPRSEGGKLSRVPESDRKRRGTRSKKNMPEPRP